MRTPHNPPSCCEPSTATRNRLAETHAREIERIAKLAQPKPSSLLNLDAPDAYAWTLYHLLQNEDVIKNTMFPITYYRANGAAWADEGSAQARYYDIGETGYAGNLDDRTLSLIADVEPSCEPPLGTHRLLDMAVVIRSKDAGINRLTFDIIFTSGENYEAALRSNVFSKNNIAKVLGVPWTAWSGRSSSTPATPSRSRSTGPTSRHRWTNAMCSGLSNRRRSRA